MVINRDYKLKLEHGHYVHEVKINFLIKNIMEIIKRKTSDIKIFAKTIEHVAYEQIKNLGNFEAYLDSKIRIMPDVHVGKGCVIGFTANLGEKVIN